MIKTAMVLAAGYGTRLKPLTDHVPKPLVPVAGRPMIDYALEKLQAYGVREIVINVSHLKDQLVAHLATKKNLNIQISEEAEPLETGGGLKKAQSLLGNGPVFVINSDIIWTDEPLSVLRPSLSPPRSRGDCPSPAGAGEGGRRPDEGRGVENESGGRGEVADFGKHSTLNIQHSTSNEVPIETSSRGETALARLARHWDDAKMDFLLLAQSKSRAVGHDKGEDHLFIKRENTVGWNDADAPYIIAGVGIFHPRVLAGAPEGKFSVKILWHQALAQNRLFCLPHLGRWFQTGTIADIRQTEQRLAQP
jgi:NDP-sugar pyrophosphorylase family protein